MFKQEEFYCTNIDGDDVSYYSYQHHTQEDGNRGITGSSLREETERVCGGGTDLQFLVSNIVQQRWCDVSYLLSSIDKLVYQIDVGRYTTLHPLHAACSISSVPSEIFEKLLGITYCHKDQDEFTRRCPCSIEDEDGNLPIHIACSTPGIKPWMIHRLLEVSPETSKSS